MKKGSILEYIKLLIAKSKKIVMIIFNSRLCQYLLTNLKHLTTHPYFLRAVLAFCILIFMVFLQRFIEKIDMARDFREMKERKKYNKAVKKLHMLHRNQLKIYDSSFKECETTDIM